MSERANVGGEQPYISTFNLVEKRHKDADPAPEYKGPLYRKSIVEGKEVDVDFLGRTPPLGNSKDLQRWEDALIVQMMDPKNEERVKTFLATFPEDEVKDVLHLFEEKNEDPLALTN